MEMGTECFVCFCGVKFQLNQDKMNFSTLRNIQGLHAPLKLQMEYRAARQVMSKSPTLITPFLSLLSLLSCFNFT